MGRRLIDAARSFDPNTIALLGKAFDQAWMKIGDRYHDPLVIQAKRDVLARAILDLASVGERDIDVLREGAILTVGHSEKPAQFIGWPTTQEYLGRPMD